MKKTILAAVLMAMVSATAWAQPGANDADTMRKSDCARATAAGKTCELKMDAEEVNGGVPSATGTTVAVRPNTTFRSLIRIRMDFIAEILKTANEIE